MVRAIDHPTIPEDNPPLTTPLVAAVSDLIRCHNTLTNWDITDIQLSVRALVRTLDQAIERKTKVYL